MSGHGVGAVGTLLLAGAALLGPTGCGGDELSGPGAAAEEPGRDLAPDRAAPPQPAHAADRGLASTAAGSGQAGRPGAAPGRPRDGLRPPAEDEPARSLAAAPNEDGVVLLATFSGHGEADMTLRYEVRNQGPEDIYVCAALPRYVDGGFRPDPDRAYVSLDEADGTLRVSRRLWPIPPGARVHTPEVPYLARLAPGERCVHELRLSAPVAIDHPYRAADEELDDEQPLSRALLLEVGYVLAGTAPLQPASGPGGLFTLPHQDLRPAERTLQQRFHVQVRTCRD